LNGVKFLSGERFIEISFEMIGSVKRRVHGDDDCMKTYKTASGVLSSVQRVRDLFCADGYLLKWLSSKGTNVRVAISECDQPNLDTKHTLGGQLTLR